MLKNFDNVDFFKKDLCAELRGIGKYDVLNYICICADNGVLSLKATKNSIMALHKEGNGIMVNYGSIWDCTQKQIIEICAKMFCYEI